MRTLQAGPNFEDPEGKLRSVPMLTPNVALRILMRRVGGAISRATFYRWIANGRVYSVRMGYRYYVPMPALEELIQECLRGERY